MADAHHTALFKQLGHSGEDVCHIPVVIYPKAEIVNGALGEGHGVYVGSASGNFRTEAPTSFVFAILNEGWEFHEFQLDGKTWPGLSIYPDDGDASVSFGDAQKRSVILTEHYKTFYTRRYQLVLRNTASGEFAVVDPDVNPDPPPPPPPGGGG